MSYARAVSTRKLRVFNGLRLEVVPGGGGMSLVLFPLQAPSPVIPSVKQGLAVRQIPRQQARSVLRFVLRSILRVPE